MEVVRSHDASEFRGLAEPLALSRESANTLFLGLLGQAEIYQRFQGWAVVANDEVRAAALQTESYNLVLATSDDPAAVRMLAAETGPLPGVAGVVPAVDWFVAGRLDEANAVMNQAIFELTEVADLSPAAGVPRPAKEADIPVLAAWMTAFQADALGEVSTEPMTPMVQQRLSADPTSAGFWVHELDGRLVSMSGHSGPTARTIKVAPVYTPPDERGQGYATTLVARQSQWLLDAGYDKCCLYTDLANPTSNSIYQKIGYRQVAESTQYEFSPPS